ncbi:hypothetical protein [Longibaculum muris]|uniref:hypothetical protein n=1 Tax=Longibaculum muris TaxID=1796628 RepID=UPI0012B706B1|nr:hypothetical protein [Longibaculum muris]
MELQFYSVAVCYTNCVESLMDEMHSLEKLALSWDFPYDIAITVRCGKNVGRTFRRFYQREQTLMLDIRQEDSDYMVLSKNEQREHLGKLIYSYLKESIKKYPKFATISQQEYLITRFEQWMKENNWLDGKIEKARIMLEANQDTNEVAETLKMSLAEVEDILIHMDETEKREEIHSDNQKAIKDCNWTY